MAETNDIIFWFSIGSSILPLLAGLLNRERLTRPLILLLIYASIVFLVEASGIVLIRQFKASTTELYQLFSLAEFLLLSFVFLNWQRGKTQRRISIALMIAFVLLWALIKRTSSETTFDSTVVTVEAVLLVGLAVVSLLTLALENTGALFGNPRFWVSSGVLLYFAGNLIVFALFNQLELEEALNAWRFHAVLNLIANVFYMTGYLCLGRFRS